MAEMIIWSIIGLVFIGGVNYFLLYGNRENKDK